MSLALNAPLDLLTSYRPDSAVIAATIAYLDKNATFTYVQARNWWCSRLTSNTHSDFSAALPLLGQNLWAKQAVRDFMQGNFDKVCGPLNR